ncbi:YdeI/OmpD-associated family protein [Mariniphaga sp.]|uniref:YdeI/OmpD-associated family protein n=1 Tax=Mariniphaga sp. TaxID=1954475 RepID=UPI0035634FCF
MDVTFFSNQDEFRMWLEKHHDKENELLVGFYKVKTGKPSMSWSQSVDQALCFGWIDSVRKSIDDESYSIRFTPRKKTSNWSAINIKKVEELKKAGLMTNAGLKAFNFREDGKSKIYSYENPSKLASKYEDLFKANKTAWNFFAQQALSYRKIITRWIMSAKMEKTQLSRLEKTINESEQQKRIKFM